MKTYLLTQSEDLARSIDVMLKDPKLPYEFVRLSRTADLAQDGVQAGVLLLDADISGSDCMALLSRLGGDLSGLRVIVVVAADFADRCLPGFEAMRHLVSPFHKRDLLTTLATEAPSGAADRRIRIGRLMLDLDTRKAFVDDAAVPLTAKEFDVLQLLALRRGVTLSKEMFLDKLYGGLQEPEVKIIDVFVCKIRGKLKKLTDGDGLIDTVWGRGYVLHDPVARQIQHREAS